MTSVYIATPYSKPYNAQYWKALIQNMDGHDITHKDLYGYAIDVARNVLVDLFKTTDCEYLAWVESDASYDVGALARLLDHDLPMVCGCMYTRTDMPPLPTMGKFAGTAKNGKHYYKFAETAKAIVEHTRGLDIWEVDRNAINLERTEGDLYEIDGCGLHFTLIRRDVIEAVEPPYHVMLGKTGAGEDFYFCKKVRELGFPIYVDLGVHAGHCLSDELDVGLKQLLTFTQFIDVEEIVNKVPEVLEIG